MGRCTHCLSHSYGQGRYTREKYIAKKGVAELMRRDLQVARSSVEHYVTVPLTDLQKAALTLFVYNIGSGGICQFNATQKVERWRSSRCL